MKNVHWWSSWILAWNYQNPTKTSLHDRFINQSDRLKFLGIFYKTNLNCKLLEHEYCRRYYDQIRDKSSSCRHALENSLSLSSFFMKSLILKFITDLWYTIWRFVTWYIKMNMQLWTNDLHEILGIREGLCNHPVLVKRTKTNCIIWLTMIDVIDWFHWIR